MPNTYSVKEAAAILGFSTNTIYTFLNTKKLKGLRVGKGKFRIPQSEIDRMTGGTPLPQPEKHETITMKQVQVTHDTPAVFQEAIPHLQHLSLAEWFIGMGSIIFGLSMFIYAESTDAFLSVQLVTWYGILRLLFLFFGIGFIVSKLFVKVPHGWAILYQGLLVAAFGWFVVLSHIAHDPQGTAIGFFVVLVMLIQLFFAPAPHVLISSTTLAAAICNTILFIFVPSYLATLNTSFGITPQQGVWWQFTSVIIPYISYGVLILSYRFAPKLYYFLIILGSAGLHSLAYFAGVQLHWRQGLSLLFTGIVFFLYATWQTKVMKVYKKTWITGTVFGFVFVIFLAIIVSLRVFELTMYDHANKELQVKVENGKLYLETIFEYAKNSFHVAVKTNSFKKAFETNDRTTLTTYAKNMYEQFPHMYRIVIFDKEGTEVANYPEDNALIGNNYAYRAYFQDAVAQNDTVFSDALQTTGTIKKHTIVIATPIVEDGVLYGVVAGFFDMDELGRNLQSFGADEQGEYFSVLDTKGVRIINPDTTTVGTTVAQTELAKFSTIAYWKTHLDTRVNPHGVLVHATYRTVDHANLIIAAVTPYKENLQANLVALSVTVIISSYGYLAILIAWYLCYRKSKTG